MTGRKQRSGGARPGAGRLRQRITIDLEHARLLRRLVEARQAESPYPITEHSVIEDLIMAAIYHTPLDTPELRQQIVDDKRQQ